MNATCSSIEQIGEAVGPVLTLAVVSGALLQYSRLKREWRSDAGKEVGRFLARRIVSDFIGIFLRQWQPVGESNPSSQVENLVS